jgi:DNA topoisomerase-1
MPEQAHVIAGRCTTVFEGSREQEQHGDMIVLIKPDDTVLVHDAEGYQPVAWLTRPDSVTVTCETVAARDGEQSLTVTIHDTRAHDDQPLGEAGVPVGECPDCDGELLRASGKLSCPDCETAYPIPRDTTVLEDSCSDCGLPRVRVQRGCSLVCCPDCDSLTDRVRSAFDRQWDCPECSGELRVLYRGGLLLGCDRYPDCEVAYSFPTGMHDGRCSCGLPAFETASGRRCLDSECDSPLPEAGG